MPLIKGDTKLSDIVLEDPTIATVFYRFDIALGVGDNTVTSICQERNLDETFFTTILNTYISPDYFPEKILSTFKASIIIDYLTQTNAYYEHYQIPNIERHFNFLLQNSDPNNNLGLMMNFFHEVKVELLHRIKNDQEVWFPRILQCESQDNTCSPGTETEIQESQDSIEDKIDDLINMFVIYLKGNYDSNLCQAVLIVLFSLKKDITQNNRIRYRILRPLSQVLMTGKES